MPGIRSDKKAEVLYVVVVITAPPLCHSTLYLKTSPAGLVQSSEMEEFVWDTLGTPIVPGPGEERPDVRPDVKTQYERNLL